MFSHEMLDREIHVELIHKHYSQLIEWCRRYPEGALMLYVPTHYLPKGYCKPCHNNGDSKSYFMRLRELPNPLGLHVHLARRGEINTIPYQMQYDAIKQGLNYLNELGIVACDFAPGWWSFNGDTLRACADLGLIRFHIHDWFMKDLPTEQVPDGMTIVQVHHNSHDFMLGPSCNSASVSPISTIT